jgi:hypothetical protein
VYRWRLVLELPLRLDELVELLELRLPLLS